MSEKAAQAIANRSRREALRARNVRRGEVVTRSPLRIELEGSEEVLDDGDFDLSAWADFYRDEFGINKGDTALLMRESGDWTIFDWVAGDDAPAATEAKSLKRLMRRIERRLDRLESTDA